MWDTYLWFVAERHRIWEQRQADKPQPWTTDSILRERKFTNVFRILDPGTQFIMTDLYTTDINNRNLLMRLFLYRHTGRVETWQLLPLMLGEYPNVEDLENVREVWREYRLKDQSRQVFTNAYLVYPQSNTPGTDKLDSIIDLTQRLFTPGSPHDIMPDWNRSRNQMERFNILRRNKGVGDFMSMQVLTDWGYLCGEDREDQFVVPGPGCIKGAAALSPGADTMSTLRWAVTQVRALPDCPLLGYRQPSLMDVQNTLCEFSKYYRYQGQAVPSKKYQPAHPGKQPTPVLPAYYEDNLI